jgi:hypothetical protein
MVRCFPHGDVHWVNADGGAILLDLVHDRYLALDEEAAAIWRLISHAAGDASADADTVMRHILAWRSRGLVVEERSSRTVQSKPIGRAAVVEYPFDADARPRPADVWFALYNRWWADRALTRRGIAEALRRLAHAARVRRPVPPLSTCARVVAGHRRVGGWFAYRGHDCLPRSLALARALRMTGFDADLCIGVRTFPFGAHAWVELGDAAVDETPDRISEYALIARF